MLLKTTTTPRFSGDSDEEPWELQPLYIWKSHIRGNCINQTEHICTPTQWFASLTNAVFKTEHTVR